MNWCVNFPKEMVMMCRPSLRRACGQNRNAAKLLSYLLYRASVREEAKVEAQNINTVKVQQGKDPDQDTSITVYRTQGQIILEMDEELSDRTLRDDAVPCLVELGYLTFEEIKGAKQYTAYTIYPDAIQKGIDHSEQVPHFKTLKYWIKHEETKRARKNFRTDEEGSEKFPNGKISERSGKNSERSGKVSEPSMPAQSTVDVPSDGEFAAYKSNNKEITLRESIAHVSDDNAPTLSNSPSSLFSQYDLLLAYRDNQLEHLYECEKAAMVNMSKKLSPNRAGELAAAKLSVQFCEQYVRFKDEIDNLARTPSQQVTPEQEDLYDWLVDHWNVRADVTTLSGTRTLILDEDMYRSSLQSIPPEEKAPAQSDEQSSKQESGVSDSQSKDVPPVQETGNTSSGKPGKASSQPAKPAQSKLIEDEPKAPARPQMPAESMKWGTNKCKLMFDAWRGAPLMVEYKLMQASKVAKNLATYYSEDQVRAAKARMDEDEYYINLGGADIMDVGNNIAKYLKRIETEAKKQRKNSGSGNDNTVSQTTQTAAAMAEAEQSNKANLEKLRARKAAMQAKQKGA